MAASPLTSYATVYNLPPDLPPTSLSAGDTMNVYTGAATLPSHESLDAGAGSTINVYGGAMGLLTYLSGDMNVFGGQASSHTVATGAAIDVFAGATGSLTMTNSVLNVYGGQIGGLLKARNSTINMAAGEFFFDDTTDSTINMSGGKIVVGFPFAGFRTTLNVSGGELGSITLQGGSELNLSGGGVIPNSYFTVLPDATAHLYIRSAVLNGLPAPGLTQGVEVPIDVKNVDGQLDVILQNGSPFSFALSTRSLSQLDPRPAGALISTNPLNTPSSRPVARIEVLLTLVPEPAATTMAVIGIVAVASSVRRSQRSFPRRDGRMDPVYARVSRSSRLS